MMVNKIMEKITNYLWSHPLPWLKNDKVGEKIQIDGDLYLTRTYLTGRSQDGWPVGAFIHHFHRGDKDRELHNHPWNYSLGVILAGGYSEERRMPDGSVKTFMLNPGSINIIRANDFHRVDLLDKENGCWTLFFRWKRIQDWGFWDRNTKVFTPWREFLGIAGDA